MNYTSLSIARPSIFLRVLCASLIVSYGPAVLAEKQDVPEVSSDGLNLVEHTKHRIVYSKAGATLDAYTKVKILDCYVEFKKDWQKDYNLNELGLDGRVRDRDAEAIKTRVAAEFRKEFTKVLGEKGHEVVDDTGADVLLLRPAIINLDVTAPDIPTAGMRDVIVASAGSMTLYLELYDSATSELLARVVDAEADPDMGPVRADRVTNTAAADRILRRWAEELAGHLGDTQAMSGASPD